MSRQLVCSQTASQKEPHRVTTSFEILSKRDGYLEHIKGQLVRSI